jgi:hypothetical protein
MKPNTNNTKKSSALRMLTRLFRSQRSSTMSKKVSSFRDFFDSKKKHKKPLQKSKKSLRKLLRKMKATKKNTIPALAQADTFETVSASFDEGSYTHRSTSIAVQDQKSVQAHNFDNLPEEEEDNISYELLQGYDDLEDSLSVASRETLELYPELDRAEKERSLAIVCSAATATANTNTTAMIQSHYLSTPPSSTIAIYGGSPQAQYTAQVIKHSQDIFRSTVSSPKHFSYQFDDKNTTQENLQIIFNPSFEGIEMTESFAEDSLSSLLSPKAAYYLTEQEDRKMASWKLCLAVLVVAALALQENDGVFQAIVATIYPGIHKLLAAARGKSEYSSPGLELIPESFFKTHHTPIGVWLK